MRHAHKAIPEEEAGVALLCLMYDDLPPAARESVWAYPRRPRVEPCPSVLRVTHSGRTIARTARGLRVIETGHPPRYFFPLDDVVTDHLVMTGARADTEHLGEARLFDVRVAGRRAPQAAWTHVHPPTACTALRGHVAFFAGRVDGAFVDGERVIPQPGGRFGGWITSDVVGPYEGSERRGLRAQGKDILTM